MERHRIPPHLSLSSSFLPPCPHFHFPFLIIWRFGSTQRNFWGFSDSSVGKESTCNAGDPSSIPGSGRSDREGIGYPLKYSWASLVAQLVKNLPAMWETWVRSLEKGKATHSSILAWKIPWTVCIVHGVAECQTRLSEFHWRHKRI